MNFKYIVLTFFICFLTVSYGQKKKFSKIADTTEVGLVKEMKIIASELLKNYHWKNDTDSILKITRFYIIEENYEEAISNISKLDNYYKEKYPYYEKYIGKRLLIYSKAKLRAKKENISFEESYSKELKAFMGNIQDRLSQFLDYFFSSSIKDEPENLKNLLKSQKDSSNVAETYILFQTFMNAKLYEETNRLISKVIKEFDEENYIINDSIIVAKGDVKIPVRVVRNRKLKGKQPTILKFSIYADDVDLELAKSIADKDYVAVIANTRGKWLSDNELHPFENDGEDAYSVIDWISKQSWSNGKVGMFGGSYLGFSQWATAKRIHPALKTIVPQVAVGVGVDYPMQNNVFMSYMLRWIHYVENNKFTDYEDFSNAEKWEKVYGDWFKSGKSFRTLDSIEGRPNKTFQRWLNHPDRDDYWKNMVADKNDFSKINIPILTITGYFDDDQSGALYYFKEHHKYHKNPNHYLVIGPYDHGGAQGNPNTELKKYTIDSVARISVNSLVFSWFNYILKEDKKPILLKDKINYQVMEANTWEHASTLEELQANKKTFYLSDTKVGNYYKLQTAIEKNNNYVSQKIDFSDRTKIHNHIDFEKLSIIDSTLNTNNGLVFISDPIEKDMEINGSFSGELSVMINKKDIDYTLLLFELKEDGTYFYLSNYIQRASYSDNKEERKLLKPNTKTKLNFKDTYFTSKKLVKGSKLILIVNINKNPEWEINYGTGKEVSRETIKDAGEPLLVKWFTDSYIEIPTN
ncbi:CocE/NonD family hydrolase [Kordia sp.]|uniref:CocE/NonD family hydrolase n=1 Tax=Kordia sp. TaxID=1965332 RepID=UPI003B597635